MFSECNKSAVFFCVCERRLGRELFSVGLPTRTRRGPFTTPLGSHLRDLLYPASLRHCFPLHSAPLMRQHSSLGDSHALRDPPPHIAALSSGVPRGTPNPFSNFTEQLRDSKPRFGGPRVRC